MKKSLLVALLGILSFSIEAQTRISLTKTADKVETLTEENQAQNERIVLLEATNQKLVAKTDSLEQKQALKIPTSVEEANGLLVYILGFAQWLLVGVFGEKLPKWLDNFVLSMIIGAVIAVVAYFFSGGQFTLNETFTFFFAISGFSNITHRFTKYQAKRLTKTAEA